jgi:uncharacterized membrane protein YphA (DoxX/SURF4 family)
VTLQAVAGVVLGAVLLLSGAAKLAAGPRWAAQAAALGSPDVAIPVVPWLEIGLGALLVVGVWRAAVALAAAAMLIVFTGLLVVRLAQGRRPPCACFGAWSARPIGLGSVVRNVVLIALALAITFWA